MELTVVLLQGVILAIGSTTGLGLMDNVTAVLVRLLHPVVGLTASA